MCEDSGKLTEENIFGKQRGRYDEVMAQRRVRQLCDDVFYGFIAMNETDKRALADRIRKFETAEGRKQPRWELREV